MLISSKILAAGAIVLLATSGGAAFTAGSITDGTTGNTDANFVAGQITNSVVGATVTDVNYTIVAASNGVVSDIKVTFADDTTVDGLTVTVTPHGGTGQGTFTDGTPVTIAAGVADFPYQAGTSGVAGGYHGLSGIDITVARSS